MSKGKRKTRRRGQYDPVRDEVSEQPVEENINNHNNLLELTADELKK